MFTDVIVNVNESQRPVKLVSLFGGSVYVSPSQGFDVVSRLEITRFLLISALLIVITRQNQHFSEIEHVMSGGTLMMMHVLCALVVVSFIGTGVRIAHRLCVAWRLRFVFLPAITVPAAVLIQLSTSTVVFVATGQFPETMVHVLQLLTDICVILLLEALFAFYVAPQSGYFVREKSDHTPTTNRPTSGGTEEGSLRGPSSEVSEDADALAAPSVQEPATVPPDDTPAHHPMQVIQTSVVPIPVHELILVVSRGHYLHFVMAEREVKARGTLKEFAARVDVDLGVRVNRSVWVALHAVSGLTEDDGKSTVTLIDGSSHRVADSRRIAVSMAYQKFRERIET